MTTTPPVEQRASILIVDDTLANLRVLTQMLSEKGYRVRPAPNGELALASARASTPDLVLLDVRMPGMDGYEVCRRLKADPQFRDVPVLFLSALDDVEDKVAGFTAGAVDYVTKPFSVAEVLARVDTHLALRRTQISLQREIAERDRLIAELDAYAHTVAHDLKGPINVVMGYADYAAEFHQEMSAEDLEEHLRKVQQGAAKMSRIIEGLLLLASTRQADIITEPLDMDWILDEALHRLAGEIEAAHAQIVRPDRWPEAKGYAPWVEEIWVNYLSNALKYGGRPDLDPPQAPLIEIGTETLLPDQVRFWVRDNGRGIAPDARERLFLAFDRLGRVGVKGHGLGLSIVLRIAQRLGGQVACESRPDQGTTFIFTLPAVGEDE